MVYFIITTRRYILTLPPPPSLPLAKHYLKVPTTYHYIDYPESLPDHQPLFSLDSHKEKDLTTCHHTRYRVFSVKCAHW